MHVMLIMACDNCQTQAIKGHVSLYFTIE